MFASIDSSGLTFGTVGELPGSLASIGKYIIKAKLFSELSISDEPLGSGINLSS